MDKPQRHITVGILTADRVEFALNGGYSCRRKNADGSLTAELKDGKVCCNGITGRKLEFKAAGADSFFTLKDVTIGVDFHWERRENQSFKGNLILLAKAEGIIVINDIGIEDYLTSVISSEMSAEAPLEFLKAHAVISRSWLLAQICGKKKATGEGKKDTPKELITWQDHEDHEFFDVCADDHCQRYQGITKVSTATAREAIEATWGEVLAYEGQVCDARFSKCCGGKTEVFSTCWEDTDVPYLRSFKDKFCDTEDAAILANILPNFDQETKDFYRWEVRYTFAELSNIVRERTGMNYGKVVDLRPIERGPSGRIKKLKIVGSRKSRIIGKELEIRRTLSRSHLYSSAFEVEKTPEGFILHGKGWGHGVGMCQIGAAVMGHLGYLYKDILLYYYRGAEIVQEDSLSI
ncbi:MAG: SpoIID/LytB domain-containing protein [Bacteroidales bacterium]|nr:SpoIID/LytB domain-containing protein [Bacteroidales bacterium]